MLIETNHESWLQRIFLPVQPRSVPHYRAWNIGFRTAHLMAISVLIGGHAFNAPPGQLRPLLYAAIATGSGLTFLDAYPALHFVFEARGVLLLAKLALLCLIPFAWAYRVPILLVVVALAAIGSHMPSRFRHYSFLYRKVIKQ